MDYLRSTYDTTFIYRNLSDPVSASWMQAKEGSPHFPAPHAFFSLNWQEGVCPAGLVGEQPGFKPWTPRPKLGRFGYLSMCRVFLAYFLNGIPAGRLAPPVDSDGVPFCCSPTAGCLCQGLPMPRQLTLSFNAPFCGDGINTVTLPMNLQADCSYLADVISVGGIYLSMKAVAKQLDDANNWGLSVSGLSLLGPYSWTPGNSVTNNCIGPGNPLIVWFDTSPPLPFACGSPVAATLD